MRLACTFTTLSLLCSAVAAQNTPPGTWDFSLGVGALAAPSYSGSDTHKVRALPFASARYSNRFSVDAREGLRFNPIAPVNTGSGFDTGLTLGLGLGVDFGREEDASPHLQGLGDIDPTLEFKLYADYRFKYASVGAAFSQDTGVGGGESHGGHKLKASLTTAVPILPWDTFFIPSVSATYASDAYMQSYYGVDASQAAVSALPAYQANAGLVDAGLSLTAIKNFNERWSLVTTLGYKRLLGDAADSPVTVSRNQTSGGLFLAYGF